MTYTIIGGIFILMAVYMLASASGLFAERSGTINLSINGGMIMGAIGYIMTSKLMVDDIGHYEWYIPIVGIFVGVLMSMAITMLLSFASINLKGNQIIVGTAINVLAPIISLVIIIAISNGQQMLPTADFQTITNISQSSTLEAWHIQMIIFFVVGTLMVGLFLLIRKTNFGLRLRAAGENPHALAASGVSVYKIRHFALMISGALAGLAGAFAVSSFIKFSSYSSTILGMGYIALAILILGQWRMQWIMLGSLAFSAIYILAYVYGPDLDENQWFVYMIPYVSILITLPLISLRQQAPKAAGIPYENSGR